jgi:NAD(P)-dependent dehydrogenase (short-subunit alcohol dehydrogenase family)
MTERTTPVAVVTGAARGLGRVIAVTLAEAGYDVALVDVATLEDVAAEVEQTGAGAWPWRADVAVEADVLALAAAYRERFERVDVLVNNAGISMIAPAENTSADAWRRVIDVNLTGPFLLCREFGALMLSAGSGSIVNVASVAGLRGVSHRVAYNASKHGLIGLTSTLAVEWGGRGVRVNAVCPGWIKTEMDAEDQGGGAYTDSDITGQVPLARFAAPEDVATAVAFLADGSKSGFINGVALPVDGGWSADASWTSLRLKTRPPLGS